MYVCELILSYINSYSRTPLLTSVMLKSHFISKDSKFVFQTHRSDTRLWVCVHDQLVILKKQHVSVYSPTFCNVMLTFSRLTHLSVPSMSSHLQVSWIPGQPLTFRAASATTLRYKYQHVCRKTSRNGGVRRREMWRSSETRLTGRRPPLLYVTSALDYHVIRYR